MNMPKTAHPKTEVIERYRRGMTNYIQNVVEPRGISRSKWAENAGVRESSVREFVNGDTNSMQLDTVGLLAKKEGVPISVILGDIDYPLENQNPAEPNVVTTEKKKTLEGRVSYIESTLLRVLEEIGMARKKPDISSDSKDTNKPDV